SENNWGLRAGEVIGTSFEALDIGLPTHLLRDNMAAVQSNREMQVEQVLEGINRRGRPVLCRVRISGLIDEEDRVQGLVLVMQEITEERRTEDYVRYLGRVVGRALNEVYFLDPNSLRFVLTNAGAQ